MLTLERFCTCDMGTFGRLTGYGLNLYTVEKPWAGNKPFESCIPCGIYDLVPHSSETYPDVWALVGPGVSHYPEPGVARNLILIHTANRASELGGCIAPGLSLGVIRVEWAVLSSRLALECIREALAGVERPQIDIRYAPAPQYP